MALKTDIAHSVATQFVSLAISLAGGILAARLLGPAGKGAITLLQADSQLLVLLFGFSLSNAIVYFVAAGAMTVRSVSGLTLVLLAIGIALAEGALLAVGSSRGMRLLLPEGYATVLAQQYLVISFALTFVSTAISSIFRARKQFILSNHVNLFTNALNCFALAALACLSVWKPLPIGVDEVLIGLVAASAVSTALWLVLLIRSEGASVLPRWPSRGEVAVLAGFLGAAHLANVTQFLNYRLDNWIVGGWRGVSELGIYALAVNIGQLLWLISAPVGAVLLPYFSSASRDEHAAMLARVSRINFATVASLSVLGFALAGLAIPLAYGSAFAPAVPALRILLPGLVFSCQTKIFVGYLLAEGAVRTTLGASLLGLIVTVALDLALIPRFGFIGASLASTVSYFVTFAYVYRRVLVLLHHSAENFFIPSVQDVAHLTSRINFAMGSRRL